MEKEMKEQKRIHSIGFVVKVLTTIALCFFGIVVAASIRLNEPGQKPGCYGGKLKLASSFRFKASSHSQSNMIAAGMSFKSYDTIETQMILLPWCVGDSGEICLQLRTEHLRAKMTNPLLKIDWDSNRKKGNNGGILEDALSKIAAINTFITIGRQPREVYDSSFSYKNLYSKALDSIQAMIQLPSMGPTGQVKSRKDSVKTKASKPLCELPATTESMLNHSMENLFCHQVGEVWFDTTAIEFPTPGRKISWKKHVGHNSETGLIRVEVKSKFFPNDEFAEEGFPPNPDCDTRTRATGWETYDPVVGLMVASEMHEVNDIICAAMGTSISIHSESTTSIQLEMIPREMPRREK